MAAARLLLQKTEPGPAKVQCVQQGTFSYLRGSVTFSAHVRSPAFHRLHRPQAADLRLSAEVRQMLAPAIQSPGLHFTVHY